MKNALTPQQEIAINLIQADLRFLYTIVEKEKNSESNYILNILPIMGTIIDGTEDWLKAYNNSSKNIIEIRLFSLEEQQYYEKMRSAIKLWEMSYSEIYQKLKIIYNRSNAYFGSLCKPIAKFLHLYDIFGVDMTNSGFCGNTILSALYLPDFEIDKMSESGQTIKAMSEIAGEYIAAFAANQMYPVDESRSFVSTDFGGFVKSPLKNRYSDKFVLFCILCQTNLLLYGVDQYIQVECPAKLRFMYLHYFYVSGIITEINKNLSINIAFDRSLLSREFRNAMAHYKVGIALKKSEIVTDDLLFGLTQKYLNMDYWSVKGKVQKILVSLSKQITDYLGL